MPLALESRASGVVVTEVVEVVEAVEATGVEVEVVEVAKHGAK